MLNFSARPGSSPWALLRVRLLGNSAAGYPSILLAAAGSRLCYIWMDPALPLWLLMRHLAAFLLAPCYIPLGFFCSSDGSGCFISCLAPSRLFPDRVKCRPAFFCCPGMAVPGSNEDGHNVSIRGSLEFGIWYLLIVL